MQGHEKGLAVFIKKSEEKMEIYNKSKKVISIIAILLMTFSPTLSVLAEESSPVAQPVLPANETVTESQPTRGVIGQVGPTDPAVPVPTPQPTPITINEPVPPGPIIYDTLNTETITAPTEISEQASNQNISNDNGIQNSEENITEEEQKDNSEVKSNNEANVVNEIRGIIGTAGNVITEQRGNTDITTGDAGGAFSLINLINSIFAGLGQKVNFIYKDVNGDLNTDYIIDPMTGNILDKNGNLVVINQNTGPNSENTAESSSVNNRGIITDNEGNLVNDIDLVADTGNNMTNNKVGDNLIDTGDINLSLNLLNFLNSTFVVGEFGVVGILNILGDWTGNLFLPKSLFAGSTAPAVTTANNNTGTNSENDANSNSNNSSNTSTNNYATVNNDIDFSGNTGGNEISSNIGDSNIVTGSINFLLNTKTFANLTVVGDVIYMAFVNVLGEWNGSDLIGKIFGFNNQISGANVENTNTGTNSTNSASSENSNKTTNTTNNTGVINNLIDIFANTGNNKITSERGDSTIQTGDIDVLTNIINFINTNITGKRLVMLFVNVFGDWNGNIDFAKEEEKESIVLQSDNDETPIQLAETKTEGQNVKNAVFRTVNKFVPSQNITEAIQNENGDENTKPIATTATFPNIPDDTVEGLTAGKNSNEFNPSVMNWVVFAGIFVYLASIAIYLKASKKIKYRNY
jgi:hypothetical protein